MHGNIVPAEQQMSRPEGAVRPLPSGHDIVEHRLQSLIELREAPPQQSRDVDALGIVIEFTPINGTPRSFGEWLGQARLIEQILDIVPDPSLDRRGAVRVSRQPLDFRQRFHHKAGMEVVHEASRPIHRVAP